MTKKKKKTKPKKTKPLANPKDKVPTGKQASFVDHYIAGKMRDASSAAALAGYSTKSPGSLRVQAHRLLKLPHIRAAISAHVSAAGLSRDEVLFEITQVALGDISQLMEVTAGGDLRLIKGALLSHGHLVQSIKEDKDGNIQIRLNDRMDALKVLAKFHGIFKDGGDNILNLTQGNNVYNDNDAMAQGQTAIDKRKAAAKNGR